MIHHKKSLPIHPPIHTHLAYLSHTYPTELVPTCLKPVLPVINPAHFNFIFSVNFLHVHSSVLTLFSTLFICNPSFLLFLCASAKDHTRA